MLKIEVEKRLDKLKDCKLIKFTMQEGIEFKIPYENIKNYSDVEMIEALENNFQCFYCSIYSIEPIL